MGATFSLIVRRWAEVFLRYFANSDYLAGMLAMSMMGVAHDATTRACSLLLVWVVRRLWVTVRLEEKDAELVLAWLRERPEVHRSSQLSLYSQRCAQGHSRVYEYEPEIQVTTRLRCTTKAGRGRWIWVTRRDRGDSQGERRLPGAVVSFFGGDKGMLESILEVGREIQRRRREKYLTVVQVYDYGKEVGLNWLHPQEKDRKQPGRSISSVVLPRCPATGLDQAEALLEDAREFLSSELWYTERGIPYRRGYLLHGVPGGGKSSVVMAVASELRLPIYMLQLSSELMSDDTLNTLLQYGMHDPPTILLLEDVDLLHSAVLHRRSSLEEKDLAGDRDELKGLRDSQESAEKRRRGGRLSLSGLLNALDGPTATTGRLLFMTTNARDRLDPALLRSGRIDYEVEFREAEPEQIQRLFVRFYSDFRSGAGSRGGAAGASSGPNAASAGAEMAGGAEAQAGSQGEGLPPPPRLASHKERSTRELADAFAEQVAASGVRLTTADIQRHLMKRKTDPERALSELPGMLRSFNKGNGTAVGSVGAAGEEGGDGAGKKARPCASSPRSVSGTDADSLAKVGLPRSHERLDSAGEGSTKAGSSDGSTMSGPCNGVEDLEVRPCASSPGSVSGTDADSLAKVGLPRSHERLDSAGEGSTKAGSCDGSPKSGLCNGVEEFEVRPCASSPQSVSGTDADSLAKAGLPRSHERLDSAGEVSTKAGSFDGSTVSGLCDGVDDLEACASAAGIFKESADLGVPWQMTAAPALDANLMLVA